MNTKPTLNGKSSLPMRSPQSILPSAHTELTQRWGHLGTIWAARGIGLGNRSASWARQWVLFEGLGLRSEGSTAVGGMVRETRSLWGWRRASRTVPPGLEGLLSLSWDVNANCSLLQLRNKAESASTGVPRLLCLVLHSFLVFLAFHLHMQPSGSENLTWKIEVLVHFCHLNTTVLHC